MRKGIITLLLVMIAFNLYSQHKEITNKEELIKFCEGQKKYWKEKVLPNVRLGFDRWPSLTISPYICKNQYSRLVYESYGVDLTLNGMFDKDMRKRVLQLLKNEYEEGELEKAIQKELDLWGFNKVTYSQSRINWRKLPKSLHKIYKDTSSIEFKAFADSCWQVKMESMRKEYTENYMFELDRVINICYYLNDKKIKKQLIKMYNDTTFTEYYHNKIQAALIRRKIEPYYTKCFKRNMYSDTTNEDMMTHNIDTLSKFIHSQESFLELSKFLLTNKIVYWAEEEDNGNIVSQKSFSQETDEIVYNAHNDYVFFYAFIEIKWKIRNQDLWDFIGYHPNNEKEEYIKSITYFAFQNRKKIYDWMQANYGKYEIAPQW